MYGRFRGIELGWKRLEEAGMRRKERKERKKERKKNEKGKKGEMR